jgi:hypothetical protein
MRMHRLSPERGTKLSGNLRIIQYLAVMTRRTQPQPVNASGPSPSTQFSAFLSRFPAGIVAMVEQCLPKLRRAIPHSFEIVYNYSHSVVVSFSASERGYEAIVAMAVLQECVRLYFDKSLPDPNGLLKGTGTKVRSVTLKAASDLDQGDIKALIKAAIKHSGVTSPGTRPATMIIKSDSKKKKPGKTGKA